METERTTTHDTATKAHNGSFFRFLHSEYNRTAAYPVGPMPDATLYRPAASWIGRLILPKPEERRSVIGALMEVQYAEPEYGHLIGQVVRLRWSDTPENNQRFWSTTRPVAFSRRARKLVDKGYVLAERVDHWQLVNPFESLIGAYPIDEMIVRLPEPVIVEETPDDGGIPVFWLPREPVQTTGRFYGLVRFLYSEDVEKQRWRVVHFQRETGRFEGPEETVLLPTTLRDKHDVQTAVNDGLDISPANEEGWYIYGALDRAGTFVVQALMPRGLMRLRPHRTITDAEEKRQFLQPQGWRKEREQGTFTSTLLCPANTTPEEEVARWKEGDVALIIHIYGTYLRKDWTWQRLMPYWGHFSFGTARVVTEPLTGELRFDIEYHQIYVHTDSGIISGNHHWTRYTGDRQFGFLGTHPTQDYLIRLPCFTEPYPRAAESRSPLTELAVELERMAARYRIADGRGGESITSSNNCAQDSSQALYAVIKRIDFLLRAHPSLAELQAVAPDEAARVAELARLGQELKQKLLPFGAARADWERGDAILGSSMTENPLTSFLLALRTWHTMIPSIAARHLARTFLAHEATLWALRTNLVGGHDPTIEPYVVNV